jgi:hypothetical protein
MARKSTITRVNLNVICKKRRISSYDLAKILGISQFEAYDIKTYRAPFTKKLQERFKDYLKENDGPSKFN